MSRLDFRQHLSQSTRFEGAPRPMQQIMAPDDGGMHQHRKEGGNYHEIQAPA